MSERRAVAERRRRAEAARAAARGPGPLRRALRLVSRGLFGALALVALALAVLPRGTVGVLPPPPVPAEATPLEVAESVAAAERLTPGIREGLAKTVTWAGEAGARTPLALVYVHGFSASRAELAPLPARLAEALDANLFETRLAGHGRGGAALGRARAEDWMLDMAEALAVGRALGERVLVLASSTGASLAAIAALEPPGADRVAGYVLMSPNFGLQAAGARLLTLPFARSLAPLVLGAERRWEPRSEAHGAGWTHAYPTEALVPMAALAQTARLSDHGRPGAPALFLISDRDSVVDPAATREVAGRWGAANGALAEVRTLSPGPGDDPDAHVLAGDALSPGLTDPALETILDWIERRGIAAPVRD